MNIKEQLKLLGELIDCNFSLFMWQFSTEGLLTDTTYPYKVSNQSIFSFLDTLETFDQLETHSSYPAIYESTIGLLWIVCYEYKKDALHRYHLIGPALSGNTSFTTMSKRMDEHQWSIHDKSLFFKNINDIPVVPTNILYQYAIMLHYCLTGQRVSTQDLQYPQAQINTADTVKKIASEHQGIWSTEQQLLDMIRHGNTQYKEALEQSSKLSTGVKFDVGDTLRRNKNNAIVLLTLSSRAAIDGGLSPSLSFNLCDYYMQVIEETRTIAEVSTICNNLLDDFIQGVREAKEQDDLPEDIQYICNYIQLHLEEPLSIGHLADELNYTDYYFSKKFKLHTGISVNDYINKTKIDQVKLLLRTSNISISEISDQFAFTSRSYFSTLFKKNTGMSPKAYRHTYQQL